MTSGCKGISEICYHLLILIYFDQSFLAFNLNKHNDMIMITQNWF